jgi:hypothetical protein
MVVRLIGGDAGDQLTFTKGGRAVLDALLSRTGQEMFRHFAPAIKLMTLGNERALGMRSLDMSCWNRRDQAVLNTDRLLDGVAISNFGRRMVYTRRLVIGADAGPNWREPPWESLIGWRWRS